MSAVDFRWMLSANCVGLPTNLFVPDDDAHGPVTKATRRVCEACKVTEECREFAIATRSTGYWGGTSETERKDIVRRRAAS